jgi:hypothetical protein
MKKHPAVFTFLLLCALSVAAQTTNPALVNQELDFAIRSSVDENGNKYIGYAGQLPSLFTFVADDGQVTVCTSNDKTQQTYMYEYTPQMEQIKTMTVQNELAALGAFTKDTEGNYYFFYGVSSAKSAENMAMVKYDKNGKKLKTYMLSSRAKNSMDGIKTPFDAGTCRLEISGTMIAVYFARLMFNGHQASYGFVLDKDTFERVDNGATTNDLEAGRKIMPYVSHSFNQWIVPVENGFVFADHGDAYPRSFTFARFQTNDRTKRINAFTFTGARGQNGTFAQMGGMAKTSGGYIFAGTYGKSASNPRNLFIMNVSADLSSCGNPVYLTAYKKQDGHAAHPKITALDSNRYLLLWELCAFSTQSANAIVSETTDYKGTYMMIIDENGKPLSEIKELPQGVRLNMNDVLRWNKVSRRVYWTVNGGSKSFVLWSLDPDKEMNYKVDPALFNKPETADPEHFKYTVNGKKGEAQTITITKYTGPIKNLIIPDTINGIPIAAIGKEAFTYSPITSVVLPATVKVIEDQAFWYSNITALVIPEGVESIGKQAFSFCKRLTVVSIPLSLKTVKEFAFMDCPNLTTVTVPRESDMVVGYGAFDKCPNLDTESLAVLSTF